MFPRLPQCSNKRGQNLAGHMIRARLAVKPSVQTRAATGSRVRVRNCGRIGRRQQCPLCPHLGAVSSPRGVVQEVQIHHSGEVINITQNITCTDVGCLYLLSCTKQNCRKQYIGESGDKFTRDSKSTRIAVEILTQLALWDLTSSCLDTPKLI